MKKKLLLMTIAIALLTTGTAWGQATMSPTVNYNTAAETGKTLDFSTLLSAQDATGVLKDATAITLVNEWTNDDLAKLLVSLRSDGSFVTENTVLQTVNMANATLSGTAISFDNMFFGCKALTAVAFPTEGSTAAVSFNNTFMGCAALKSADLSGFTAISNMMSAFFQCTALESVKMPATNTPPADGVSFNTTFTGCTALKSIDLSAFAAISDMNSAFYECTGITGVKMPAAENAAEVSFYRTFCSCTALTGTVDLSGFVNISNMRNALTGCTLLTGVTMPATENAANINFASTFSGCAALKSVDLSAFTAIADMYSTFLGCTSLTDVKLGGTLTAGTMNMFESVNPNCLVYAPQAWTRPYGWDIIYIAGDTADGSLTLTDNQPFRCPEAFALGAENTLSYARTLTKDKWATVCLPFAAPVPTDCLAKELSGSAAESVYFAQVQAMEANKPYIVAYTGVEPTKEVTFTSEPAATVAATPDALEKATGSYTMAGTYTAVTGRSMYLLDSNAFLLYNKGNLHPFRAYITRSGGAPNQAPSLTIGDEGDVTGIGCIPAPEAEAIPALSRVYTIDGRLVKTVPAGEYNTLKQGLAKGVYIVNGTKVAVTE